MSPRVANAFTPMFEHSALAPIATDLSDAYRGRLGPPAHDPFFRPRPACSQRPANTIALYALRPLMTIIQFAPFSSLVEPAFWHALTNIKIDVLRLSDHSIPVTASYTPGRSIVDRETGNEIALGCNITVGNDAFVDKPQ